MNIDNEQVCNELKAEAYRLGFERIGFTIAQTPESYPLFRDWVASGNNAGMQYLSDRIEARSHPKFVLPEVKSLIVLAVSYENVLRESPLSTKTMKKTEKQCEQEPFGIVATYARGMDYHDWARLKMKGLEKLLRERRSDIKVRGVVDTAPIMERQFAYNAGIGWFGKNSMLIDQELGSRFFLCIMLLSEHLSSEEVTRKNTVFDGCGTCRLCIDACPSGAISENRTLDARKCINYWTIEAKEPIPESIARVIGNRLYGCDTCQDVCPWNTPGDKKKSTKSCIACGYVSDKFTAKGAELPCGVSNGTDGRIPLELIGSLDERAFEDTFGQTPVKRIGLEKLKNNLKIIRDGHAM